MPENFATLFPPDVGGPAEKLSGYDRQDAVALIRVNHYTRCVPSGKSYFFRFDDALIVFSIPANRFAANAVLGRDGVVWELTRLWAPDDHQPNLLTRAVASAVRGLREAEPTCEAVVSYADPNAGHHGGIYQAASWIYQGQSTENRAYVDQAGQVYARRKFHSGDRHMTKAEIEARGFRQFKAIGKHRYAKAMTRQARRVIDGTAKPYPKPEGARTECKIDGDGH